jgi:hypothetical protein
MPLDSGTAAIVRRCQLFGRPVSSSPPLRCRSWLSTCHRPLTALGRPASAPPPLVHFGLAVTTPDGWLSLPAPSKAVTRYQYVTLLATLVSL